MSAPAAELAQAYALLRNSELARAEHICREVLGRFPCNPDGLHLLGLIRKDAGDAAGGESLLRESIQLDPHRAEFRANLGNLLRRLGRDREAVQCYREALVLDARHHMSRLGLARSLNDLGEHAAAESESRRLVREHPLDPVAWSALAMTLRDQQRHAEAEATYRKALQLAPDDKAVLHNLGAVLVQTSHAEEALAHLDRAASVGLHGFELAMTRGRALLQLGRLDEAEAAFEQAATTRPHDAEAQLSLARLRFMRGDPEFARSVAAAAAANRDDMALQMQYADILQRTDDLQSSEALLRDLVRRSGSAPAVRSALATVLHKQGRLKEAELEALEAVAQKPHDVRIVEGLVVVQLANGRASESLPFIRAQRARMPHEQRWIAYEATAARLLGRSLYRELCDYERFVRSYEIEAPPGWSSIAELNGALFATLSAKHRFVAHPFDQSLRHGSQTAHDLLRDPDPSVQAVLRAFQAPLQQYRSEIGAAAGHPLTGRNRGAAQISSAWSVRLHRDGFHVNHIHPEGWISSAYYVSLPAEVQDTIVRSGWIKFGETRHPVPGAHAERFIQPKAGTLILFPSYLWHGTIPISGVEPRLTIAFDAVPST